MDQALTNKKFIQQIDDVIETLGGTPVDLELTEDREDDMVSNGVFADKMDEVIEALGGTPSEIAIGDDKADDMVSGNIFQLKMEDVVKNMSGGSGGNFSTAEVTFTFSATGSENYVGIGNDENGNLIFFGEEDWILVYGGDNYTVNVPIPTGKATKFGIDLFQTMDYSVARIELSGGITHEGNYLIISGDGTIAVYDI